jgi:hypothetical protein
MKAGAADLIFLNEPDAHAELTGSKSGCVATTSCAENDKIKSVLSHE